MAHRPTWGEMIQDCEKKTSTVLLAAYFLLKGHENGVITGQKVHVNGVKTGQKVHRSCKNHYLTWMKHLLVVLC